MAEHHDPSKQRPSALRAGHVLVWTVPASASAPALAEAAWMGLQADAHRLGRWGIAERGLGGGEAYFDLTLDRDVDPVLIKLIYGRGPDHVY